MLGGAVIVYTRFARRWRKTSKNIRLFHSKENAPTSDKQNTNYLIKCNNFYRADFIISIENISYDQISYKR